MKLALRILIQVSFIMLFISCIPEIRQKELKEKIDIIPKPLQVKYGNRTFILNAETKIVCPDSEKALENIVALIVDKVSHSLSCSLKKWDNSQNWPDENYILLKRNNSFKKLGDEGYHLSVNSHRILIEGYSAAGVFYGYQTLRQLLPIYAEENRENHDEWIIRSVDIVDKPQFVWRGNMLDASRHFIEPEFIKKKPGLSGAI